MTNEERYLALRDAAVTNNQQFIDALEEYAEKYWIKPNRPTAKEFDDAIDKVKSITYNNT